jgi:RNA polymerase sigma factor (TIGR02999 family)
MNNTSHTEITLLLNELQNGNKESINKILPLVYNELRRLASKYLKKEYSNRTIQTTELVHEAYLKLIGSNEVSWQNRTHFFGIAANAMRQILVDYARKRKAGKRGEGKDNISLDDAPTISVQTDEQILALDNALKKLETVDERSCKIVELRYFSGLTIEETAEFLEISPATTKRDWNFAKAWLYREIKSA